MDRTRFRDAMLLVKGSRKFGFERIAAELQLKTHQTLLEIDLDAMVSNLNHFSSLLKEDVKIMVMVKALSYGSGNIEIANMLQYQKVDYLAVAFIDEGIELRKSGIQLPIMVLNPDPSGFGQMMDFNLEPEIYNLRGLEELGRILNYREIKHYPIHIKLDTGMHRLGFQEEDIVELLPLIENERLSGWHRSFRTSPQVMNPGRMISARSRFDALSGCHALIAKSLEYTFDRHILNSAGIERFPDAQYQMVRLGIGITWHW